MSSISAVLPVYNEASLIEESVLQIAATLRTLASEFEIVVTDDGSVDDTASILVDLEHRSPELNLRVARHERNQGYGAALATGFNAASKDLIFFTDADQQFDIAELGILLAALDVTTDLAIGWRQKRADPPIRLVNAWGWKLLVNRMFGYTARDIDCAFKLFRRSVWNSVVVHSRGATFSAEFLIKVRRAGFVVKELPVRHYPRTAGVATGAKPAVIARALRDLAHLWWAINRDRDAASQAMRPSVGARFLS